MGLACLETPMHGFLRPKRRFLDRKSEVATCQQPSNLEQPDGNFVATKVQPQSNTALTQHFRITFARCFAYVYAKVFMKTVTAGFV
jgi:hypothetical protein